MKIFLIHFGKLHYKTIMLLNRQ